MGNGNLLAHFALPTSSPFDLAVYLSRSYDAHANDLSSELGRNWTSNLRRRLHVVSASVLDLYDETSNVHTYSGSGPGYTAPAEAITSIISISGVGWRETFPDGSQYFYTAYNSNSDGRLTNIRSKTGQRWTITHDDPNTAPRVRAVMSPFLRLTTFVYDASNKIRRVVDPGGRITTFNLDASNNIRWITTPELCITSMGYQGEFLTKWIDPELNQWEYSYLAPSLRIGTIKNPLGVKVTFTWQYDNSTSPRSPACRVSLPTGGLFTYTIDTREEAVAVYRVRNAANQSTSVIYSPGFPSSAPVGRPVYTYDALGNRTALRYQTIQGQQRLNMIERPDGGRFTYTYDGTANLVRSIIDPSGNRSTLLWDSQGNRTALQEPGNRRTTYAYDSFGQMRRIQTPEGRITTRIYDSSTGLLKVSINPANERTTYAYNAYGKTLWQANPLGNITTFIRDKMNRVTVQINPLLERTTYTYDLNGRLTATTDAAGRTVSTRYDGVGRVKSTIDPAGNRTTFGYDGVGNIRRVTNPLGNISTVVFDLNNRRIAEIDPELNRTSYAYDAAGNTRRMTDGVGSITTWVYDKTNRRTATIDGDDNRSTTVYDKSGQVIASVNALGKRWTNVYDQYQRTIYSLDPNLKRTTTIYDKDGYQIGAINVLGQRSTMTRDLAGRVSRSIDALGTRTTYVYDKAGRQVRTEWHGGAITSTVYDNADRVVRESTPLDARTTLAYFAGGQVRRRVTPTATGAPSAIVSTVYDNRGMIAATIDPLARRSSFSYDAAGRLRQTQDPRGKYTTTIYDKADRSIATMDQLGYRTTSTYDAASRVRRMTNGRGKITSFVYDQSSDMTTLIDPLLRRTTYAYDALNRRSRRVDGRSVTTIYLYDDNLNQPAGMRYTNDPPVTFSYDALGNRTRMQDGRGYTTYVYDALNRVRRVTNSANRTVSYLYDALSRRTLLTTPDNERFTYTYDLANRLTRLVNPQGERTTWSYDLASRPAVMRRSNGCRTSYSYDVASQATRLVHLKSDNTTISSFSYKYDDGGNPTRQTEATGVVTTWTYDNANQLKSERRSGANAFSYTLTYDAAGNSTIKTVPGEYYIYDYDAANQLSRAVSIFTISTFTHDQAGNQTREKNLLYTTTLVWDDENRVKSNRSQVIGNSVSVNTLSYDGDGLLARLDQFNGTVIKPVWDGQNILLEQDAANATQVVNTFEPAGYGNLISHKRSAAKRYYLYNRLGTTDRLLDDTQNATDIYILDASGGGVSASGSTVNPFRFIGQLGYYYYQTSLLTTATWVRARHYEPTYRRWLSMDPILRLRRKTISLVFTHDRTTAHNIPMRYIPLFTPYLYSVNTPTLYIDPSGLDIQICWRRNNIVRACPCSHYWITTTFETVGSGPGTCAGWCMTQRSHEGESPVGCTDAGTFCSNHLASYDCSSYAAELCIDKLIQNGQSFGPFIPFVNDCSDAACSYVDQCCKRIPWKRYVVGPF